MAFALAASLSAVVGSAEPATAAPDVCELTEEELTVYNLPAGTSVILCDAVGRVVTYEGTGIEVPEPGTSVTAHALTDDGEHAGFALQVSTDGIISYDLTEGESADTSTEGSDVADTTRNPAETPVTDSDSTDADEVDSGSSEAEVADVDAAASPGACSDSTYATYDLKEYGTYNWYIGDGGLPAGLSKNDALWAFYEALDNITESNNNCGYSDQVDAHKANFLAYTSYEADISSSNNCTDRDGLSTWDAGDLKSDTVAFTCAWSWATPGVKNDLREADVRFNTVDKDFTNKPTSSCSNKYDVRSVGTHEAGHVFGLKDIYGAHGNLTMYGSSIKCSTRARTLGKGDVLGLRSIY
ncbi:peptidase M10 [Streptomyces fulvoviolaceus]|uniref:peptidase M10 n=1 Tax=Streptomyces fulvoviolaceus TaxID=285535 RepID=UPI0004C7C548|nr:peptidase M10 [Streptomyces fulvoviolaceus]